MIVNADVLDWARTYNGPKFHAMLCDPPYELGFMGKGWDRQGIAFDPATWAALAEHLHPGAFGMAFASSRGWHRLAVAIEDAGLRIHPSIFGWAFGSGFPKATRVKDAPDFDGHRYGGQALKPALEPIIVFQKPYVGRPRDSITATGAGTVWVDGGRIATGEDLNGGTYYGEHRGKSPESVWRNDNRNGGGSGFRNGVGEFSPPAGRWPANFALVHSPACNGTCAPDCPARRLGEQSGERATGKGGGANLGYRRTGTAGPDPTRGVGDTGTAARFFFQADYSLDIAERIDAADPVAYVAKASRAERSAGLGETFDPMPNDFQRVSSGLNQDKPGREGRKPMVPARNGHPTVKPLALTRWLATLLLPPDAYAPRRILIPFCGSGSECIGAMLAGWEDVTAIERESEYVEISRARLAWWEANRDKAPKVRAMERTEPRHPGVGFNPGEPYVSVARANGHAPAPMLPGMEAAR